jgi:DNA-binding protein Fis
VRGLLRGQSQNIYDDVLHQAERILLAEILHQTGNNQSEAARKLVPFPVRWFRVS